MVSMYSVADPTLLSDSHDTLSVYRHENEHRLRVIDVKNILSLIAMVPFPLTPGKEADPVIKDKYVDSFYMIEKPFLDFIGGECVNTGSGEAQPEGIDTSAEEAVEAQELESSDEDNEY
ncbi:hypothetical protein AX14_004582 [Amanita brunnescens Koide BX004]|nr:hypothetical protein AX14_004582 [Amanita brunnescens Koide BX004]